MDVLPPEMCSELERSLTSTCAREVALERVPQTDAKTQGAVYKSLPIIEFYFFFEAFSFRENGAAIHSRDTAPVYNCSTHLSC